MIKYPAKQVNDAIIATLNIFRRINAKQKHLGCKKSMRPRRSSIVNESATKSSDIRKAKKFS